MTEDEMVGWHHQLDGHEFEQASVVGDGQGSLPSCSPWGRKESDITKQLNNNNKLHRLISGRIISTVLGKEQRFFRNWVRDTKTQGLVEVGLVCHIRPI